MPLLNELSQTPQHAVVYNDNVGACTVMQVPAAGVWRTRHLRLKAQWCMQQFEFAKYTVYHVPGKWMLADLATKPLQAGRCLELLRLMHLDLGEEQSVSALRGESDRSNDENIRHGKLERGCNELHELGCAESLERGRREFLTRSSLGSLERGCREHGGVASSTGATIAGLGSSAISTYLSSSPVRAEDTWLRKALCLLVLASRIWAARAREVVGAVELDEHGEEAKPPRSQVVSVLVTVLVIVSVSALVSWCCRGEPEDPNEPQVRAVASHAEAQSEWSLIEPSRSRDVRSRTIVDPGSIDPTGTNSVPSFVPPAGLRQRIPKVASRPGAPDDPRTVPLPKPKLGWAEGSRIADGGGQQLEESNETPLAVRHLRELLAECAVTMYADDLHIIGQRAVIKAVIEHVNRAPDCLEGEVLACGRHAQTSDQRAESSRDSGARTEAAPFGRTVETLLQLPEVRGATIASCAEEFGDLSHESAEWLGSIASSSQVSSEIGTVLPDHTAAIEPATESPER